jgi:hypothetical protein
MKKAPKGSGALSAITRSHRESSGKHFKMTFWAIDMYIAPPAPDGKILINASMTGVV